MATIHPSRVGRVPNSNLEASTSRESELRKQLHDQKAKARSQRAESKEVQRRPSPTYERYEGENRTRDLDEYVYDDRDSRYSRESRWSDQQPNRQFFEDRNGAPPAGIWPQRDSNRERRPPQPTSEGWLESRQELRKQSNVTIWPPSPTSPYRSESEEKGKRGKERSERQHRSTRKHSDRHRDERRRRYSDESDDQRSRHRSERKHRHRRDRDRSRSPRRMDTDSEDERRRRRKRKESSRRGKEDEDPQHHRHRSPRYKSPEEADSRRDRATRDGEGYLAAAKKGDVPPIPVSQRSVSGQRDSSAIYEARDSKLIGPKMPEKNTENKIVSGEDDRAYGKALMPGEGSAMANFVQDGQRIPRRGEIGLTSDQIEAYEKVGFVMSGSRHQRMNAVRMRKENQVYSAEEQRSMLKMIAEEKQKKEAQLIEQFKDMVDSIE